MKVYTCTVAWLTDGKVSVSTKVVPTLDTARTLSLLAEFTGCAAVEIASHEADDKAVAAAQASENSSATASAADSSGRPN